MSENFQSKMPLAPHFFGELSSLFRELLSKFIRKDTIDAAVSGSDLLSIKVEDPDNWTTLDDLEIGEGARRSLQSKKVKPNEAIAFRKECRAILILTVKKISERSPLKYQFTEFLSGFNPRLFHLTDRTRRLVRSALTTLSECNIITILDCDRVNAEWRNFVLDENILERSSKYKPFKDRLDDFYTNVLDEETYPTLSSVIQKVLILSHGNAAVERGFSGNALLLKENLHTESLVLLRHAQDGIRRAGGTTEVEFSEKFLLSCRMASNCRRLALERKRKEQAEKKKFNEEQQRQREEVKILEAKKRALDEERAMVVSELDTKRKKLM